MLRRVRWALAACLFTAVAVAPPFVGAAKKQIPVTHTDNDRDALPDEWEDQQLGTRAYGEHDDPGGVGRTLQESYRQHLGPWPAAVVPAGLRAWYRADAGVVRDGAGNVSLWIDVSGNGFHVQQGEPSRRPLWQADTFYSEPALSFDASAGMTLETGGVVDVQAASSDLTVIAVIQPEANQPPASTLLDFSWFGGPYGFHWWQAGNSTNRYYLGWADPGANAELRTPGIDAVPGRVQILSAVKNGTSATDYLDGAPQGTTTLPLAGMRVPVARFALGNSAGYPVRGFHGRVAEIMIYNRALSDAERTLVETQLANKYVDPDSDGDGLPDAWEDQQFGTRDYGANDDPGGVGRTLLQSYQKGVSPWRAATVAAGLRAWYRADAGVVRDAANNVSRWTDVSGHGFHVLRTADAGRRPLWVVGAINGLPAVSFNASAGMTLETGAPIDLQAGTSDLTVIAVVQPESTQPAASTLADFSWLGGPFGFHWWQGSGRTGSYYLGWADPGINAELRTPGINPVAGQAQVLSAVKSGTTASDYLDGVSQGANTLPLAAMHIPIARFAIGNTAGFPVRGFHGQIAELLVYNRALSDAERTLIETELLGRYRNADVDGDGLPDAWEDQQLGTRDYAAGDDPGGVGRTLLQSYEQGLSPWPAPVVADGLRAWYRADAGAVRDATGHVSVWADTSGHGFHVTQTAEASRQPTWIDAAINGWPALSYDGSAGMTLETRGPVDLHASSSDLTVIAVVRPEATQPARSTLLDLSWFGGTYGFHWWQEGGITNRYYLGWADPGRNVELRTRGLETTAGEAQVLSAVKSGTTAADYRDGVAQGRKTLPLAGMNIPVARFAVGNTAGYPVRSFHGSLAEVLVYNRGLSDAERARVEAQLIDKYLLALVAVTPSNPTVTAGTDTAFSATVTGPANPAVTWTASCGTITAGGVWTAPSTPGACTITATSVANPRGFASTTATVVAAPAIAGFTAAPGSILYGGTSTLTGVFSGGTGSVNNGIGAVSSEVGRATPALTATTTYTLTVTNAAGTSVTASATVNVSAVSISAVTPSNPAVTAGTTTTFSATVTGAVNTSVSWTATGGTITSGGVWTAPTTPGTYTITATSVANSNVASSTTPTVVAAPAITSFTASPASILYGGTSTLTGLFSGGAGSVNNGIGAVTSGVGRSTPALTATTTYTLTVTNAAGTSVTANTTVNVSAVSISAVTPSNPTATAGTSTTFNATVSGAVNTSVTWTATGGTITSGGVWTAPTTPGTYTITARSVADPSRASSTTATVVAPPAISSFTASPASILYGGTSTLTGVFSGGTGSVNNGIGAVTSGVGRSTSALTGTTTYTLTVTNVAGASVTASATVNVSAVSISPVTPSNPTVTAGTTTTFSATVSGAVNTSVGWTATGGTITSGGVWTAPTTPGTYTITARSVADPSRTSSTTATVVAAPVISSFTASPGSILYGGTSTLTGVFSGGTGSVNNGIGAVTSGVGRSTSALTATTTYTLTVTNAAGTSVTASTTVNVSAVSISPVTPSNPTVTVGTATTFSATVTGAVNTAVSWSASCGTITAGGVWTAPATAGTCSITARSVANTNVSSSTTATVVAAPVISFTASPASILYGGTSTLTATFSGGTGSVNNGIGAVTSGVGRSTPVLTATTTYTLTVTNAAGTSVTANTTVNVSVVSISPVTPSNPTVTAGTTTTFSATVSGAVNTSVSWTATGGTITSGGVWTAPTTPGTYTITARSVADPSRSSSTTATVAVPPPVISSFTASPPSILYGGTSTLTAAFAGGTGSVNNGIGAVTSGVGRSTPTLTGTTTYTLTVTNSVGVSVTASTTVSVSAVSISPVTPSNPTVTAGTTTTFSATVSGAVNTAVTWSASGGTITSGGAWTAPATPGTYAITATSIADPSRSSTTTATAVAANLNVAISGTSYELFLAGIGGGGGACRTRTWTSLVSGGNGTYTYAWRRNGVLVAIGSWYTGSVCRSDEPGFTLTLGVTDGNGVPGSDSHDVVVEIDFIDPTCRPGPGGRICP